MCDWHRWFVTFLPVPRPCEGQLACACSTGPHTAGMKVCGGRVMQIPVCGPLPDGGGLGGWITPVDHTLRMDVALCMDGQLTTWCPAVCCVAAVVSADAGPRVEHGLRHAVQKCTWRLPADCCPYGMGLLTALLQVAGCARCGSLAMEPTSYSLNTGMLNWVCWYAGVWLTGCLGKWAYGRGMASSQAESRGPPYLSKPRTLDELSACSLIW